MIIDEKVLMYPPPPPYLPSSTHLSSSGLPQFPASNLSTNGKPTLSSLPPHILLEIIYNIFPRDSPSTPTPLEFHASSSANNHITSRYNNYNNRLYEDSKPELQRKTLYWLSTSLRLVSRQLYTACMHVLRSTYLPSYQSLIRPPYSSDPFPLGAPASNGLVASNNPPAYYSSTSAPPSPSPSSPSPPPCTFSPLHTLQRETPVLDRFIALKVRQDVFADDTELHIEREDSYRDLFDVSQPRARLEDLIRDYGLKEGVISVPGHSRSRSTDQVYVMGAGNGTGSKNSSLVSLQNLPGSPISPSSPTGSVQQLQLGAGKQKEPKTKKSIFSFMKSPSSPSTSVTPLPLPTARPQIRPIAFALLSVSFSPRKVGLIYNRSRTIVELPRAMTAVERKKETLEFLARQLVRELRGTLEGS